MQTTLAGKRVTVRLRSPYTRGRDVALHPVPSESWSFLYNQTVLGPHAGRWDPDVSWDDFCASLETTDRHFYVARRNTEAPPIGYLYAYGLDPKAGHVHVGAERFSPEREGLDLGMMMGWGLFIQTLFHERPELRKFYMVVPEYNLSQFGSGLRRGVYVEEGLLKEHAFHDGMLHDVHYLSVSREAWDARYRRMVERDVAH